ncbi:MAG: hypothetical protein AVDCRST_MAG41-792, partial [uncultured Corynebacteriales bacterium]
ERVRDRRPGPGGGVRGRDARRRRRPAGELPPARGRGVRPGPAAAAELRRGGDAGLVRRARRRPARVRAARPHRRGRPGHRLRALPDPDARPGLRDVVPGQLRGPPGGRPVADRARARVHAVPHGRLVRRRHRAHPGV